MSASWFFFFPLLLLIALCVNRLRFSIMPHRPYAIVVTSGTDPQKTGSRLGGPQQLRIERLDNKHVFRDGRGTGDVTVNNTPVTWSPVILDAKYESTFVWTNPVDSIKASVCDR